MIDDIDMIDYIEVMLRNLPLEFVPAMVRAPVEPLN
jgi:hypothetical protein